MKIKAFFESGDSANSYLLYTDRECVVIDPSEDKKEIGFIKDNNLKILAILLTHAHYDHILGIKGLQEIDKDIPIYVHHNDLALLQDGRNNLSYFTLGKNVTADGNIRFVKEGDILELLDKKIEVIETPYHTMGSVTYKIEDEKLLFVGDSLFHLNIGRSDFPHSDESLIESTLKKFKDLETNYVIYSGHGEISELDIEKQLNPYLIGGN